MMYFIVARHENYNILGSPKIVHGEGFESYASKSVPHEVSEGSFLITTITPLY